MRIRHTQKIKKRILQWKDKIHTDQWWSSSDGSSTVSSVDWKGTLIRPASSVVSVSMRPATSGMSPIIPAGSEVYGARQQEGGGGHLVFASAPHTVCIIVVSLNRVSAVQVNWCCCVPSNGGARESYWPVYAGNKYSTEGSGVWSTEIPWMVSSSRCLWAGPEEEEPQRRFGAGVGGRVKNLSRRHELHILHRGQRRNGELWKLAMKDGPVRNGKTVNFTRIEGPGVLEELDIKSVKRIHTRTLRKIYIMVLEDPSK